VATAGGNRAVSPRDSGPGYNPLKAETRVESSDRGNSTSLRHADRRLSFSGNVRLEVTAEDLVVRIGQGPNPESTAEVIILLGARQDPRSRST